MKTNVLKKVLWLVFYSLPVIAYSANFTEPRGQTVHPQRALIPDLPLKVTIYRSLGPELAGHSRLPVRSLRSLRDGPTPQEVKAYVLNEAAKFGVNPQLALWIVKHESQFNPRAKGDGEASRGLWQISRIYHPEVSDATAFSVASSTEWSLERIRSGKAREWSTYRFCRTLYGDCPF